MFLFYKFIIFAILNAKMINSWNVNLSNKSLKFLNFQNFKYQKNFDLNLFLIIIVINNIKYYIF